MTQSHLGELAAMGTAVCWTLTAIFFAEAGRRMGSMALNFLRLLIAFAMLMVFQTLAGAGPLPRDAGPHAWLWLSVSGLVGFTFGDLCLFRAFVLIGPRLSALVMSLAPPLTAGLGWLILGETLGWMSIVGMALTMAGIMWAVADRRSERDAGTPAQEASRPNLVTGVTLAAGGAVGQAVGLILSKLGMGDYDPFASTQIRILAGAVGFAVLFTLTRWWPHVRRGAADRRGMTYASLGSLFGPFLGVSLSLVAVQRANAGIAAAIMATAPVLIIPVVVLTGRESVGRAGWAGAVLAVAGVCVLFLAP